METKKHVHAITTGRPKEEDPNVLESLNLTQKLCFHQIFLVLYNPNI
jgi:hypothetical protein